MKIECTYEMIFHFNCPSCKGWWSHATDFSVSTCQQASLEMHPALRGSLLLGTITSHNNGNTHCMHCGYEGPVELKEGFLDTENAFLGNGEL